MENDDILETESTSEDLPGEEIDFQEDSLEESESLMESEDYQAQVLTLLKSLSDTKETEVSETIESVAYVDSIPLDMELNDLGFVGVVLCVIMFFLALYGGLKFYE